MLIFILCFLSLAAINTYTLSFKKRVQINNKTRKINIYNYNDIAHIQERQEQRSLEFMVKLKEFIHIQSEEGSDRARDGELHNFFSSSYSLFPSALHPILPMLSILLIMFYVYICLVFFLLFALSGSFFAPQNNSESVLRFIMLCTMN